jgi:hypothetical protein
MKPAVLLLVGCNLAAGACLIGGTVRDADSAKPLAHVRVFAKPEPPEGDTGPVKPAILRVTSGDGEFCFDSLERAVYTLVAQRAGYLVSLYGAPPGRIEGATRFTMNGHDATPPVAIRMVAGGSLSGTVLDDRGQPVEGTLVDLQRKIYDLVWKPFHVAVAWTRSDGTFHFSALPPGTYYLRTEPMEPPEPDTPFFEGPLMDAKGRLMAATSDVTYYSGSYTFAQATPVALKAGQEIDDLMVAMKPRAARRVSGRVVVSGDPGALADGEVEVAPVIEIGGPADRPRPGAIHPDGTFAVTGLRPMEYKISVEGLRDRISARVDLSGGDVEGLVLAPERTVDLHVTARLEGQEAPPTQSLMVCDIERACGEPQPPDPKGRYRFKGLRLAAYRLRARGQGVYVKSVTVDGRHPGNAPLLDLRKTTPQSIAVVLGANLGSLEGRIERGDLAAGLGVSVLLVDETLYNPGVSNNFVAADQNGRFRFDGVPPSRYRVLAIEGFDDGPWGSPELLAALRDKSIGVEIGDGERKTATVPVIPVAEWEAALRKVGM